MSWWRTGKPGVLQSAGSQRVGHDLMAEQQQPKKENPEMGKSGCVDIFCASDVPKGKMFDLNQNDVKTSSQQPS